MRDVVLAIRPWQFVCGFFLALVAVWPIVSESLRRTPLAQPPTFDSRAAVIRAPPFRPSPIGASAAEEEHAERPRRGRGGRKSRRQRLREALAQAREALGEADGGAGAGIVEANVADVSVATGGMAGARDRVDARDRASTVAGPGPEERAPTEPVRTEPVRTEPVRTEAAPAGPAARSSVGGAVASASTAELIGELHTRKYDWEALHGAGVRFSDFSETELLHWLRRVGPRFQEILGNTSLGYVGLPTARLLRELSRRPDLAATLRETGLGSGTDFNCKQDESPRDAGCQIQCRDGRKCTRGHELCRQMGHCVAVDINRGGTWATLKSLQVYMPRPPPVCDGYAFHPNGSAPLPILAPAAVQFEVSAPHEDWCFRDTGFDERAAAAYRADKQHASRRCTFESCFDMSRCRAGTAAAAVAPGLPPADLDSPLSLFVGAATPRSYDMRRLPQCLRQSQQASLVDSADAACLVLPTVNMNCEWEICDPATASMLRAELSWGGSGRNNLIWDYNDNGRVPFETDEAMHLKTSMSIDEYRRGFDVPFPLLPNGEASHATPEELRAARGRRELLASFKGVCTSRSKGSGAGQRPALRKLHNGRDLVMICTDGSASASQWDYKMLMLRSKFSVAPAGNGLHSFRLAEAIFFESIPVIVDDKIVLPFCSVLDWREFSVRIRSSQIPQLPQILREIAREPGRLERMQARLAEVKRRYFLYPFSTAMGLVRLRVREAQGKASGHASGTATADAGAESREAGRAARNY